MLLAMGCLRRAKGGASLQSGHVIGLWYERSAGHGLMRYAGGCLSDRRLRRDPWAQGPNVAGSRRSTARAGGILIVTGWRRMDVSARRNAHP